MKDYDKLPAKDNLRTTISNCVFMFIVGILIMSLLR